MRTSVPPVLPPPRRKWLNIVFDLNGILCHTAQKSSGEKFSPYQLQDNVLSHRNPTIIGPKAVYARQNIAEFLREVSSLADRVLVWTSMFKRNAEPIAGHLFRGCKGPYDILSQDQCSKIEVSPGRFFQIGIAVLCMKVLSEHLFTNVSGDTSFSPDNTLLIDDSPAKSICNENGNAIFLRTWNQHERQDDVLMGELLPWLRRLDSNCQPGHMRRYVEENRIGLNPLRPGDYHVKDIINGMRESSMNMGSRYRLPGIGVVIEGGRVIE